MDQNLGCQLGLYADDTVLYLSDSNLQLLFQSLNTSLGILCKWCFENRLTVNANKTKAMIFSKDQRNVRELLWNQGRLIFDGVIVEFVKSYMYLGISIDDDLNFVSHINKLVSRCSLKICTLSKIRKYINEEVAIKLYKSLVLPIIDYGDVFYDCASKNTLDRIQKLQNRALRKVSLAQRFTSSIELHTKFNVLPLYMRRVKNLQKLMHSYLLHNINQIDFPWSSAEGDAEGSRVTRLRSAPYVPLKTPKTSKYKDSFGYSGPKLWLSLPLCFRQEADPSKFKLLLKAKSFEDLKTVTSVFG